MIVVDKTDISKRDRSYQSSHQGAECCCMCFREIPDGKEVLRKVESEQIICVHCLIEVSEVTI